VNLQSAKVFLILLALATAAAAASLDDYRARLTAGAERLHQLDSTVAPKNANVVERVLTDIPKTEKVEWEGGSLETDNAWLADEMSAFLSEGDTEKRKAILQSSEERLLASASVIADLQQAKRAETTKDADKQKLAEILRRAEYQPVHEEEESLFQRGWKRLLKWIDSIFPSPKLTPGASLGLGSFRLVLQILVFAVALALIAFLVWRFFPLLSSRFKRGGTGGRQDRVILGEIVSADESASDIFDEAERLAREGDIRGAIRKGYIAVLCELGDMRLVRLARSKTNRDYLRDVRRTPTLHDHLSTLTENYERNWYGLRTASVEEWEAFREGYLRTVEEPRGKVR